MTPKVGQKIYVNSAFYLSHGSDDVVGGIATVTSVSIQGKNIMITVAEHPGVAYGWGYLEELQSELKKEFG